MLQINKALNEIISTICQLVEGDFALGGELAGSLPAMVLENRKLYLVQQKYLMKLLSKLMFQNNSCSRC